MSKKRVVFWSFFLCTSFVITTVYTVRKLVVVYHVVYVVAMYNSKVAVTLHDSETSTCCVSSVVCADCHSQQYTAVIDPKIIDVYRYWNYKFEVRM